MTQRERWGAKEDFMRVNKGGGWWEKQCKDLCAASYITFDSK